MNPIIINRTKQPRINSAEVLLASRRPQETDMNTIINEILMAKTEAGEDAYLWLHDSGDCILWASEAEAEGDDGHRAIGRWPLDEGQMAALIATGEIDQYA
jgi:hypothetical protein